MNRYTFNIGNRTASSRANAISEYAANLLNQYPPSPGSYGATRWHKRLDVDNVLTSAYDQIVTTGVYSPGGTNDDIVTSVTGHLFTAETPEGFTYDADGNLLADGRFAYAWDAENRLISIQTQAGLPGDMPILHVAFEYDYMSRRVGKTVYEWDGGATNWVEKSSSDFLYDGWNLIHELTDSQTHTFTNFFTWGLDLSGSLQGAGGVGGLLSAVLGTNSVCYTFDGNGNVSELVDTGAGTPSSRILAHYEYSPFGETIVATGDLAKHNPFRFSTKYTDDETTLVYYGYRYYSPSMGRWVNRDPLGEWGGINLYVIVYNNTVNNLDGFGLHRLGYIPTYAGQVEICTVSTEKDSDCKDRPCKKCSTIWFPTGDKIKDALDKLAAEGKEVNSFTLKGHGDEECMTLGWSGSKWSEPGDIFIISTSGNVILQTSEGWQDIRGTLETVLAPDALIVLDGCNTARGENSLAEKLSKALGITTQGNTYSALNIPFTATDTTPRDWGGG